MKIRQSALFNTELNAVHMAFAEKAQSKNLENLAVINLLHNRRKHFAQFGC